jgi:hypothetical protein
MFFLFKARPECVWPSLNHDVGIDLCYTTMPRLKCSTPESFPEEEVIVPSEIVHSMNKKSSTQGPLYHDTGESTEQFIVANTPCIEMFGDVTAPELLHVPEIVVLLKF